MTPMSQMYDDVRTIIQTRRTYLTEIGRRQPAEPPLGSQWKFRGKRPSSGTDDQMENASLLACLGSAPRSTRYVCRYLMEPHACT